MVNKKLKEVEGSQIIITRASRLEQDGKQYIKKTRSVLTKPLDLGSIKNPKNQDVVWMEVHEPSNQPNQGNIFGQFFQ